MKKACLIPNIGEHYNNLDKLIVKNGWTIQYDAIKDSENIALFDIVVKAQNGDIVIVKRFEHGLGPEKMDEIIYNEIVQILRERKLNELLS